MAIPFWNSPRIAALGGPCFHITLAGDVTLFVCIHHCIPFFHFCYLTCSPEAERAGASWCSSMGVAVVVVGVYPPLLWHTRGDAFAASWPATMALRRQVLALL